MRLPLILILYLPLKYREPLVKKHIQHSWDNKSDEDIMTSFNDAQAWTGLSDGSLDLPALDEVAARCQKKLDMYILPQMKKRGLSL